MHYSKYEFIPAPVWKVARAVRLGIRMFLGLLLGLFSLGLTGCIVPLPDKVTQGHRYSAEALAFLDEPDTTRAEVVATLGAPLLEHESQILLYEWEQTPRYLTSVPTIMHGHNELRTKVNEGYAEMYGLFIAYDAHGLVEAHEVRKIRRRTLEEACVAWQKRREKNR
jgi:hypothetical protein